MYFHLLFRVCLHSFSFFYSTNDQLEFFSIPGFFRHCSTIALKKCCKIENIKKKTKKLLIIPIHCIHNIGMFTYARQQRPHIQLSGSRKYQVLRFFSVVFNVKQHFCVYYLSFEQFTLITQSI